MNCDDFLPALETGGPIRRLLAGRHAARCSRCSAVHAKFEAVKMQLAEAPPLTGREKVLWRKVAEMESRPGRSASLPPWSRVLIPAALAAVVIAVGTGLFHRTRPHTLVIVPAPRSAEKSIVSSETVLPIDSKKELDSLSVAVDQLDSDMEKLRGRAEKLQARREVAVALDRFDRW